MAATLNRLAELTTAALGLPVGEVAGPVVVVVAGLTTAALGLPVGEVTGPVVVVVTGAEEVGAIEEVEGDTTGELDETGKTCVEVVGTEEDDDVTGPVLSE